MCSNLQDADTGTKEGQQSKRKVFRVGRNPSSFRIRQAMATQDDKKGKPAKYFCGCFVYDFIFCFYIVPPSRTSHKQEPVVAYHSISAISRGQFGTNCTKANYDENTGK